VTAGRAVGVGVALAVLVSGALALALPARVRIPRLAGARSFAPAARAVFSHTAHEPLRCFQCHPAWFPQAALAFGHEDMDRGRFCAGCHDGRRAPAVASYRCESCHVAGR
jgi:c(7)-type cytochrome triheme protein